MKARIYSGTHSTHVHFEPYHNRTLWAEVSSYLDDICDHLG